MVYMDDFGNVYRERNGKREPVPHQEGSMKINGEEVFRFDEKSGLLEISMDQSSIDLLIKKYGGLPIAEMRVPIPFVEPVVQNVREIRPLPMQNGQFFIQSQ